MKSIFLKGLQRAINQYLRLDPETLYRLEKMDGKIIEIDLTDLGVKFYVAPDAQGLKLLETAPTPDAIISGTSVALFRASCGKSDTVQLFKDKIKIHGDLVVGERLRKVFQHIDIDWEEYLSHFMGDTFAHVIYSQWRRGLKTVQEAGERFCENTLDYFLLEAQLLPTREMVDQFYHDVAQLRDDVERAQVKIDRLIKHQTGH